MNLSQLETLPALENPFFHRGPIRDHRYFFGRGEEIRRTLQMLRNGQCISIVGPRRIGKTSLLFHLCDLEVQQRHSLGKEYLFVYIDCQGLGDLDKSLFYQWLWQEVKRELAKRGKVGNWVEDIYSFRDFRETMITLYNEGYKPVFFFDEFEIIARNANLDQDLFSDLRSLAPDVIYTTVSADSLFDLTYANKSVLSSPFFNIFVEIPLSFLKPKEAEEMVLGLLEITGADNLFTQEDLTFVFEIGGYYPFFLQLACYYLFEQKIERQDLTPADYDGTRQRYSADAERHFMYLWKNLSDKDQEALRLASQGRSTQYDEEQEKNLGKKGLLYNNSVFSSVVAEFARKQAKEVIQKPVEAIQKPIETGICQLSISCSKYGWVSVRVGGSLLYEGDSDRVLQPSLIDHLDRRITDSFRLASWRFHIKNIGQELFDDLILNRPEIARGYQRAVGYVDQAALSLALHAPRHFLRLPFEAIHSEEDNEYICLKHPIYRVITDCFFSKEPLSMALINRLNSQGEGFRALVVASNTWRTPTEQIPGVEEEVKQVSELLQKHGFDVCTLSTDEATEERVRAELSQKDYLLFHYAGHGSFCPDSPEESALYFWAGAKGSSEVKRLTASQLVNLVQDSSLRFVYLSSCWGAHTASTVALLDDDFLGVMDGMVIGGIPAVLGFRWPASDNGAKWLAHSFYSAWLVEGKRLDQALLAARRTVAYRLGRDERAWFSPILTMHTVA